MSGSRSCPRRPSQVTGMSRWWLVPISLVEVRGDGARTSGCLGGLLSTIWGWKNSPEAVSCLDCPQSRAGDPAVLTHPCSHVLTHPCAQPRDTAHLHFPGNDLVPCYSFITSSPHISTQSLFQHITPCCFLATVNIYHSGALFRVVFKV